MNDNYLKLQAREDFNKLRQKGLLSSLLGIILPGEHQKLLSFYDIRELLGDQKQETYLGLRVVPVSQIIGSESRYQDFTRSFLPKARHLQERWVSISTAAQKDIILPPVQLFKVGDAYFVRDGNHRVSVARASGIEMIDAEVIEVASQVYLSPNMTHKEILSRVIEHEKKMILKETRLANFIDTTHLVVTSPGSYSLLIQHILGHKHFMEQERCQKQQTQPSEWDPQRLGQHNPVLARLDYTTVSFSEAARSWYENLFLPILQLIRREGLLAQFSNRTGADLYIWLISHWQYLKELHGPEVPLETAMSSYQRHNPASLWQRIVRCGSKFFAKRGYFRKWH